MAAESDSELKMVIVVRDDLDLSTGKLAAQVAHAAVSCALRAKTRANKLYLRWLNEGQKKVVLRVRSIGELEALEHKARKAKFVVEKITDAGLTEIPPGTVTCIGIGPGKEKEIDRITGELKLV